MPKPKPSPSKQVVDRPPVRGGKMKGLTISSRRASIMRTEPIIKVQNGSRLRVESGRRVGNKVYEILQPVSTDFVEEYVPVSSSQLRRLRDPVLYKRPIEERITLPPAPEIVYVPVPISRNQRKRRGNRGRGQQNQGQRNNVLGVLNRGNFKGRYSAGRGGHVGRGRRGGRTVPAGHYPPLEKKSVSQLDRELEDYMKKSKHPKIIV